MFKPPQKRSPSPIRKNQAPAQTSAPRAPAGGMRDVSPPRLPTFSRGTSPPRRPVFAAPSNPSSIVQGKRPASSSRVDVKHSKLGGPYEAGVSLQWPPPVTPQEQAAAEMQAALTRDFEALDSDIASSDPTAFRAFHMPMRYSDINGGGYVKQHAGFTLFKHPATVFINAARRQPEASSGDKLHISVDGSRVDEAFDAIAGLLFAEDSPIDQWKVVDTTKTRALKDSRVSRGAQITLHAEPSGGGGYSSLDLRRLRDFVARIEVALEERSIDAGVRPLSDAVAPQWHYVSYRNEFRSTREDAGDDQRSRLASEPFFKLVAGLK